MLSNRSKKPRIRSWTIIRDDVADLGRINHLLQFLQRLRQFSIEDFTRNASRETQMDPASCIAMVPT